MKQFKATANAARSYNKPQNGVYAFTSIEASPCENNIEESGDGFKIRLEMVNVDDEKQCISMGFSNRPQKINANSSSLMNLHRIYHAIQHVSGQELAIQFMESLFMEGKLAEDDEDFNAVLEHVGSGQKAAIEFVRFAKDKDPSSDKEREGAEQMAEFLNDVLMGEKVYCKVRGNSPKDIRQDTRKVSSGSKRRKARF